MKLTKLLILLLLLSLKGLAQTPTFGNTGAITLCVNGSYYLNPSTTNGTFSSGDAAIATVNSSGYVTGVATGASIVSLVTSGGTVTATITVGSSPGLSITDPLAQSSYKFNNNPQGPVGGIINYVGYNGYTYSSQARPTNTGFFRASKQLGNNAGCPNEYYIFRCTTCGTVPEYATRPQGTITGNTIQSGAGSLTYTSTNSTPDGPFTIVYLPSGGSNVSIPNITSGNPFSIGTFTSTTSYNLISVTDQNTNASTDFSGITTSISVVPPPTASLTGTQSICAGVTANLSLRTTGTGSITVTLSNGRVINTISGTTSISVTPTISTPYSISSVSDISGSGTISGSSATVSVNPLTAISVQPLTTVTLIEGATVTLSITATNATAYQWYKDGVAISGANSYSYTTTNTLSFAVGTYYVTVSNTCNVLSSTTSNVNPTSVAIGTQIWTDKNLDVTTYRNGDPIPQVTDPAAWAGLTTGAWCYYNNDPANGAIYGKLYNWYAVNDSRGLAPSGWHVPSDAEWTTLSTYLGGTAAAGGKMKSTTLWASPNTGATNESGFAGLPGGNRFFDGTFFNVGSDGYLWSATENSSTFAWTRYLGYNDGSLSRYSRKKLNGFAVRLVKDN